MKAVAMFGIVLGLCLLVASPVAADILVLNNGQVVVGKISTAASGRYKLTTEFGDQFFTREQVANYWVTNPGMEAESYYQAGVLLMSKGQRDTARQIFERCLQYDASYRDKCNAALTGGTAAAAPTTSTAGTPGATPVVLPPESQGQVVKLQCSECSGTGQITSSSGISNVERMRPCPLCGGKGFRELQIPPGYELCSDCGGFGAAVGQGSSGGSSSRRSSGRSSGRSSSRSSGRSSSEGGFSMKMEICARCAGRGVVKTPWKPAEEVPGSDGMSPAVVGFSPTPGTAPTGPTGTYNIVKDRARDVASGNQPTRPIGPSGVRPVSPMLVEDPSSADPAAGGGASSAEEVVEEVPGRDAGSSPNASGGEGARESSKEETEASEPSDYEQPGFMGKVNKYKWYIVLGGAVLLVFAVVYNKMSAKK